MQPNLKTSLVEYHYDALNRLVASTPSKQDATQRFYLKDHLVTEIQGTVQRSIMQHGDQLLAQQQRQSGTLETGLLATDQQRSVLNMLDSNRPNLLAYTPYGHRPSGNGLLSLLGFNGERLDAVTGWYLLGTGHHRPFNPVLGGFICPDSWSPFGAGGANAYAYCGRDPVNRNDPTGHFGNPWKGLLNLLKVRTPRMALAKAQLNSQHGFSTRASNSIPGSSESIYSIAGAESSSGLPSHLPSSGYASVQSHSSVDPSIAPSPPHRPPPGSSRSGSHFSTNNQERLSTGRSKDDVRDWVNSTSNVADPDLIVSSQIPRAGAAQPYSMEVQARGRAIENDRLKSLSSAYQPIPYMNKKGEIFINYKRTGIRRS